MPFRPELSRTLAPIPARTRGASLLAILLCLLLIPGQQGCRAEQPWPLWQQYRAHFLDSSGRIIDHSAGDRTTSEGQAYGMFFAMVANDRSSFDRMLRWTEDNLSGGDLTSRLPAWNWGKNDHGAWKPLDENSAADADLWLAYDCLEAGRLWHDERLTKLGTVVADHIAHSEVANIPGLGTVLLPGPQGFHPATDRWWINPSYTPPQVLARLQQQTPEGPWGKIEASVPAVLRGGSPRGLAMDWLAASATGLQPAALPQNSARAGTAAPATGSYDAIRVYLWLGTADRDTRGVLAALAELPGMASYLATATVPPLQVDAVGSVADARSPVGFSGAVYPYLLALGKKREAQVQLDRLAASLDPATGLYGRAAAYYDQNLLLFALGWKEGRYRFDRDGRLQLSWK